MGPSSAGWGRAAIAAAAAAGVVAILRAAPQTAADPAPRGVATTRSQVGAGAPPVITSALAPDASVAPAIDDGARELDGELDALGVELVRRLCEPAVATICAARADCGCDMDGAICELEMRSACETWVASQIGWSDRLELDDRAIDRCLTRIVAMADECEHAGFGACYDTVRLAIDLGAPCADDEQDLCRDGLCRDGRCTRTHDCENGECLPSEYCDDEGRCRPYGDAGARCDDGLGDDVDGWCTPPLACVAGRCRARLAAGARCAMTEQCAHGLRCDEETERCTESPRCALRECGQGMICDAELETRCFAHFEADPVGTPCEPRCEGSAVCFRGICYAIDCWIDDEDGGHECARAAPGGACDGVEVQCLFDPCDHGVCPMPPEAGEPCSTQHTCAPGAYCANFYGDGACVASICAAP